jgi:hypothetical protein
VCRGRNRIVTAKRGAAAKKDANGKILAKRRRDGLWMLNGETGLCLDEVEVQLFG